MSLALRKGSDDLASFLPDAVLQDYGSGKRRSLMSSKIRKAKAPRSTHYNAELNGDRGLGDGDWSPSS